MWGASSGLVPATGIVTGVIGCIHIAVRHPPDYLVFRFLTEVLLRLILG